MSLLDQLVKPKARPRRRGPQVGMNVDVDVDLPTFETLVGAGIAVIGVLALAHGEYRMAAVIGMAEAALLAYLPLRKRLRRRGRDGDHVARIAKRAGLRLAGPGEFDLYRLPFPVFRHGEWQGFDHVYVGKFGGHPVWVFDYWYGFEVKGHDVEESFTCAAMRIPADCPKLAISRENPWSRTWGHLGWRDIEVESENFNRRFDVSGDDRTFAFAFLAPSMIDWLKRTPRQFEFAVQGEWLLCRSKYLPTRKWWDLLRMIRDFEGRIPKSLERLYPPSHAPGYPPSHPPAVSA